MTTLNLGEHHFIDVEGLVDDADLLARLLLIPFREFSKNILIDVISPVVNLQNLLSVLLIVPGFQQEIMRMLSGSLLVFMVSV